jgi:transposase
VKGLLKRDWNGARKPAVRGAVAEEFLERLGEGKFRQARDAQTWIKKRTRKTLTESGVRKTIRRLGGKLKVPRKSHVKKDTKAAAEFRVDLSSHLAEAAGTYPDKPVRI